MFGLSYDAITDWQTRLPKKNTSGVINLLMEIAKVVDALNDHSVPRDCPYSETQKELEEMLVLLEQKLKEEV